MLQNKRGLLKTLIKEWFGSVEFGIRTLHVLKELDIAAFSAHTGTSHMQGMTFTTAVWNYSIFIRLYGLNSGIWMRNVHLTLRKLYSLFYSCSCLLWGCVWVKVFLGQSESFDLHFQLWPTRQYTAALFLGARWERDAASRTVFLQITVFL